MREPTYEQNLKERGVPFTFIDEFQVAKIDTARSRRNQARLDEPLSEEEVADLRRLLQEGFTLKPLIIHVDKDGTVWLIDGNHRHEALLREEMAFQDVYEVNTDDKAVLDALVRSWNTLEGRRPSKEEIVRQCLHYMATWNRGVVETAKTFNIDQGYLSRAVAEREYQRRAIERGIADTAAKVRDRNSRARLNSIRNPESFAKAVAMVADKGLDVASVSTLVKEVNSRDTDPQAQVEIVQLWEERPDIVRRGQDTLGGRIARPGSETRTRFFRALLVLDSLLRDNPTRQALQLTTDSDVKEAKKWVSSISKRLEGVFNG